MKFHDKNYKYNQKVFISTNNLHIKLKILAFYKNHSTNINVKIESNSS